LAHELWVAGRMDLCFSEAVLDEYRRVLAYPRFGLETTDIEYLLAEEILPFGRLFAPPVSRRGWIEVDPDDDRFIDLALTAKADALVSGDRHLLDAREDIPCAIMGLAEFLERMEDRPTT